MTGRNELWKRDEGSIHQKVYSPRHNFSPFFVRAQPNRGGGGILIGVPESQGCASEGGQQHHVTTKGRKGGGDGTERESGITWPPPLSKRSWQFATSHRIMKQHVGLWL